MYSQAFQALNNNLPLNLLPQELRNLTQQDWVLLEQLLSLLLNEKEVLNRPLKKQEANDLAKAEAAIEPAIEDKLRFVQESDDNVLRMMEKQLPKGADTTDLEETEAFQVLRLIPLIQEYDYLKQVMAKSGEEFQRKKNEQELAVVRSAIAQASPEGAKLLNVLDQSTAREIEKFIDAANAQGRESVCP